MMADNLPPERFSAYIVIPAPVYFDGNLSPRAKMLYGLLSCMSNERGYAFPRNETLQRYMGGVSEDTVGRTLRQLETAGAIVIENGSGGSPKNIRKIYIGNFYPDSLRKNAEATPRKNAEAIYSKNNKRKNTTRASEEEIFQWIAAWAADLEVGVDLATPLIADFSAFAESRKAKGKPFLTIRAVSMQANKLLKNTEAYKTDPTERIARMRFMLRGAITHNWEEVYPIDDNKDQDYVNWRWHEYGILPPPLEAPETDYF